MNSSPLAAIWHWYPLLAWVACARFCSLPLGSLSYLNFYLKLRLDSNFSYGTGLNPITLIICGYTAYFSKKKLQHSSVNFPQAFYQLRGSLSEWRGPRAF